MYNVREIILSSSPGLGRAVVDIHRLGVGGRRSGEVVGSSDIKVDGRSYGEVDLPVIGMGCANRVRGEEPRRVESEEHEGVGRRSAGPGECGRLACLKSSRSGDELDLRGEEKSAPRIDWAWFEARSARKGCSRGCKERCGLAGAVISS